MNPQLRNFFQHGVFTWLRIVKITAKQDVYFVVYISWSKYPPLSDYLQVGSALREF